MAVLIFVLLALLFILYIVLFPKVEGGYCATDKEQWIRRASKVKCSSEESYHCGILTTGEVKEFCFASLGMAPNVCPRFEIYLKREIMTVSCNKSGCPQAAYLTSHLYLYPICFTLPNESMKLTTSEHSTRIHETFYITMLIEQTSFSDTTIETSTTIGEDANAETSFLTMQVISVGGSSIFLIVVILVIVSACIIKRKRRALVEVKQKPETQYADTFDVIEDGYNTIRDILPLHAKSTDNKDRKSKKHIKTSFVINANHERKDSPDKRFDFPILHAEDNAKCVKVENDVDISSDGSSESNDKEKHTYDEPLANKYETLQRISTSDFKSNDEEKHTYDEPLANKYETLQRISTSDFKSNEYKSLEALETPAETLE